MQHRVLSGIQPTGQLHIGNYLGAIRNWIGMQDKNECLFCIVDLHAITVPQPPLELRHNTRLAAAMYIACGIDPKKSVIFNQAQVSAHSELAWILGCITPIGWLNRMTQFKDKAGKDKERAPLGLYSYPVLMAADILAYKATHVPVGEDQKQHLELARDIAEKFNNTFAADFFPLPEPQIMGPTTRVMSLRDGSAKMSKSDLSEYSRIHLTDDADTISQKIRKARTDAEPIPAESSSLEGRAEAKNLLSIYAALSDNTLDEVCRQFAGSQFSVFKPELADLLISSLTPIKIEIDRLMNDTDYLDSVLKEGSSKANLIARTTLEEVCDLVGFLR